MSVGGLHTRRTTFVIGPDRVVRHALADERSMHAHADAIVRAKSW